MFSLRDIENKLVQPQARYAGDMNACPSRARHASWTQCHQRQFIERRHTQVSIRTTHTSAVRLFRVRGSTISSTVGNPSLRPMAQCVVHALKGLACRARVTSASLPASHSKQCSALMSPLAAPGLLRQSSSRTLRSQITYYTFQ